MEVFARHFQKAATSLPLKILEEGKNLLIGTEQRKKITKREAPQVSSLSRAGDGRKSTPKHPRGNMVSTYGRGLNYSWATWSENSTQELITEKSIFTDAYEIEVRKQRSFSQFWT